MNVPKFFTDEDVYAAVASALRKSGVDTVSTVEAGRLGESDESQLVWATHEGRALVTFNVAHFAAHHAAWAKQDRHHAGIVVSSQRPIGNLLHRLIRLAGTLDAESLQNRLEYLSDW